MQVRGKHESTRLKPDCRRVILFLSDNYAAYHHPIVETLRRKVNPLGYGVLCVTGRKIGRVLTDGGMPSFMHMASSLDVAGTIVMGGSFSRVLSSDKVASIVSHFRHAPLVTLDLQTRFGSSVIIDNYEPMRELLGHVLDQVSGNDIVFLSGYSSSYNSREREAAFRDAMQARGRTVDESLVLPAAFVSSNSLVVINQLLASGRRPSAIIAANDAMAAGAIHALHSFGLDVPEDVLVSGFDDSEFATVGPVTISTVAADPDQQIEVAVDELMRLIDTDQPVQTKELTCRAEVRLRRSTQPDASVETNARIENELRKRAKPHSEFTIGYAGLLASHEIRESMYLQLARCQNRTMVFGVFRKGMRNLGVPRAFLVQFNQSASSDLQHLTVLCATPSIPDRGESARQRMIHELCAGSLVVCGVEINGVPLGALIFDPAGPPRASMDGIARAIFSALHGIEQREQLERQSRELASVNDELARLANLDAMTGLPNRTLLQDELTETLTKSNEGLAVAFVDLDGFKQVNDVFGHLAGDHLLKVIASRAISCVRENDVVARVGGDEFIILLNDVNSAAKTHELLDTLLNEATRKVPLPGGNSASLSLSIGVATFPAHGSTAEELIHRADTAMYQSKRDGGNSIAWYTPTMVSQFGELSRLRQAMREGLGRGEFRLTIQPRVDLHSGRTVAGEGQLRWRKSGSIDVPTDVFLDVAERSGFLAQLDEFAFSRACELASEWYHEGIDCRLAIKVSALRLKQTDLVQQVESELFRHDLPADRIEFEITETAVATNIETSISTLHALKELGVPVSIDQFGTAHSSVASLQKLPASGLKLDRSFLSNISSKVDMESPDARIVRTILQLGIGLGFKVVADGVVNDIQRQLLTQYGCAECQGYLFSAAKEIDAFYSDLIDEKRRSDQPRLIH